jgi:hypothetical protein
MKKTITATVTYTLQDRTDPDDANRAEHRNPEKPFEVMDSDGFRETFAASVEEAEEAIAEAVGEALGLSCGVALGTVDIETTDG